jgi:hypothetical protein
MDGDGPRPPGHMRGSLSVAMPAAVAVAYAPGGGRLRESIPGTWRTSGAAQLSQRWPETA